MFMDDNDETTQESEEFTFSEKEEVHQEIMERRQDDLPSFEEPRQITSEVEEYLLGNKIEFEEVNLEKENEGRLEIQEGHVEEQQETGIEVIDKSEAVNIPTNKLNYFLANDSLCMQESRKQPKEKEEKKFKAEKFLRFSKKLLNYFENHIY
ncbi:hypothetical protein M9H77_30551 [Catharanthus roseus]|uniref:Uncharacterized protein n=1 Tax=Catharanthus roseus TaxID=4058 RepID=A0ACB9ZXW7_CATRO|nr:hypothetical protein M9H77_30551 [Catharanthus roseus]